MTTHKLIFNKKQLLPLPNLSSNAMHKDWLWPLVRPGMTWQPISLLLSKTLCLLMLSPSMKNPSTNTRKRFYAKSWATELPKRSSVKHTHQLHQLKDHPSEVAEVISTTETATTTMPDPQEGEEAGAPIEAEGAGCMQLLSPQLTLTIKTEPEGGLLLCPPLHSLMHKHHPLMPMHVTLHQLIYIHIIY